MKFVSGDGLRAVENGFELDIRLPWYRSLPLSVVDFGAVCVNGSPIDPNGLTVKLNGKNRKLRELAGLWQEYWFVLDSAFLCIPYPGARTGESYDVDISMVIHPPYVPKVFFPWKYGKSMRAN